MNEKEDSDCQIISLSQSFHSNHPQDTNSNSVFDENMDVLNNSDNNSNSNLSDFEFRLFSSSSSSSSSSNESDSETEESSMITRNKRSHSDDSIDSIRKRNNQIIEEFFEKANEALNRKFEMYQKQFVKMLNSFEKPAPRKYYEFEKIKRFHELVSSNSETILTTAKPNNNDINEEKSFNEHMVKIDNIISKKKFEQEMLARSKPLSLSCLLTIESSRVESNMISITLMWNVINKVTQEIINPNDPIIGTIEEYELYCFKQKKPKNFTELFQGYTSKTDWVLVGTIKSCDLPIKCVLGDLSYGFEYYFAIKIRDKNNNTSGLCKEVKISF